MAGTVRTGDAELDLPGREAAPGPVKVDVRSESLRIATAASAAPALEGRVDKAAYLGTHMEYTVFRPVGELVVIDHVVTRPAPAGTPVWVSFEDHGVTVVP